MKYYLIFDSVAIRVSDVIFREVVNRISSMYEIRKYEDIHSDGTWYKFWYPPFMCECMMGFISNSDIEEVRYEL